MTTLALTPLNGPARCPRALFILVAALIAIGAAFPVRAAEFTLHAADAQKLADVPTQMMAGTEYVPVDALAAQFGGGSSVEGRRVQIDLQGLTAIVEMEDTNVYATQTQFTLSKPVISIDGRPYIAVNDVIPFFKQGFSATVEPGASEEALEQNLLEMDGVTPAVPEGSSADQTPPANTAPVEGTGERLLARRVIIDPGHGGYDTGYISPRGVVEKDLTLALAQLLGDQLKEKTGVEVVYTRSDDTDASIRDRIQRANEQQADLLVSLHGGAAFAQQAHGIAIFHAQAIDVNRLGPRAALDGTTVSTDYAPQSAALAEALAQAVQQNPDLHLYNVLPMPLRLFDRAGMPGVLVEVGFLSNPEEEQLLTSDAHRAKIAAALAEGIAAVLRQR